MELEDPGGLLLSAMVPESGLRLDLLFAAMLAAAQSLSALHDEGLLHGDIRLDGILASADFTKLYFVSLESGSVAQQAPISSSVMRPSSSPYAAPERSGRLEASADERADLYSLGATFFHMCVGHPPFDAFTTDEFTYAHIARPAPNPCEMRPEVPEMLGRIVLRLLQKDPDARYQNAATLARDLSECQKQFNKWGTVRAFELGQEDVSRQFRIRDRLYGRDAELERLNATVAEGLQRHCHTVISISGPSGSGKTAIFNAMRLKLAMLGAKSAVGKFDQFLHDRPYSALIQAARALLRPVLTLPEAAFLQLRDELVEAVGGYGILLTEIIPELATILGQQPVCTELPPADAARRFNGIVVRFLKVFARRDAPLVLFIDDVQWADIASLTLIEALSDASGLEGLVVVLGFRSTEINAAHPAHRVIEHLHNSATVHIRVLLEGLHKPAVLALLHDTLGWSDTQSDELANVLMRVSLGNIFLIREYLATLHATGAITHNQQSGEWHFENAAAEIARLPDTMAAAIVERLSGLPGPCLDLLKTASCISDEFTASTLAEVHDLPRSQVAQILDAAIGATIIVAGDGGHQLLASLCRAEVDQAEIAVQVDARYRFRHDQLRRDVHLRFDATEVAARHLLIGRNAWKSTAPTVLARRATEIFEHFVRAAGLLAQADDWLELAKLGLEAGKQSYSALAFSVARRFLEVACNLMPEAAWQAQPELLSDLMIARAKCASALLDRAELERIVLEIRANVRDHQALTEIQCIRMQFQHTAGNSAEALDNLVELCQQIGFPLPRKPSIARVLFEVMLTLAVLGRKRPIDYASMEETGNLRKRSVVQALNASASAAYFAEPNLLPIIGARTARYCLRDGLTPGAAYGISVFGLVLCGSLGAIERGYGFGQLGVETAKRYGSAEIARTSFMFNAFIRHWKESWAAVVPDLHDAWLSNLVAGDLESATYSAGVMIYTDFLSGRGIDTDIRYPEAMDFLRRTEMPHVQASFIAWIELLLRLRAPVLAADLIGEEFDYPANIGTFVQDGRGVLAALSSVAAGVFDHLAGRYRRAEERFAVVERFKDNMVSQVLVPGLAFFRSRNAYLLAEKEPQRRAELARIANRMRHKITGWAKHAPRNQAHWSALLDAEAHLLSARPGDALMSLHRSAELAGPEAPLYVMMAHARRAEILRKLGLVAEAEAAAISAVRACRVWGSSAIAERLLTAFDLPSGTGEEDSGIETSAATVASILDMGLISASEADTSSVLNRILAVVLKVASADQGVLVLLDEARAPQVGAIADLSGAAPVAGTGLDGLDKSVRGAVETCLRTALTVPDTDFDGEAGAGVVQRQGSSLCVPVLHRGALIGALHLVNSVSRHAFGPKRVSYITAAANQAAIVLESERLVSRLRTSLERQTQVTEANQRFVPDYLMRELGMTEVTKVNLNLANEVEMAVVFFDLRGFTALSHQLGAGDTIRLINRYLEHVQPGIAAYGGFVGNYLGDGLLALFPSATQAMFGVNAMARGLAGYNASRGDLPELSFGMGVHSGKVTIGMIGDRDHIQCGVLGDAVNVAARLQELTKQFSSKVIISGDVVAGLEPNAPRLFRPLGRVTLRGRPAELEIFEDIGVLAAPMREMILSQTMVFAAALALMQSGQRGAAHAAFLECAVRGGNDPVALAMAAACL